MHKHLFVALSLLAAFMLSGCRSSKLLSEATEIVNPADIIREIPEATFDNTPSVYVEPKTPPVVLSGDRQEQISVVDPNDASLLKDYNIVVGSFGNRTNADNMKARMTGRGFASFLVQNAAGLYRVVAASFDDRETAVSTRDQIRATYATDDPNTCPAAWLLIPAL